MSGEAAVVKRNMSDRTRDAISDALAGRSRGVRAFIPIAGPALIASVAYLDPGNFATNIQSGASYGYTLLWVVLMANLMAMLFQALSAKLGIVTGRNLAELCRENFPRPLVYAMWVVSEIAAMATELAELLGGALALHLLFDMPLMIGMIVTAVIAYVILLFQRWGFRPIEIIIAVMVLVVGGCYLIETVISPPNWGGVLASSVTPRIPDAGALVLAVGMIGATIMPHAIYLHSGLTQDRALVRNEAERKVLLRFSNREVILALGFAGLVNMSMVMMAASAFYPAHSDVADIDVAYKTLGPLLGAGAAVVFLISLLASGLSSSAVGTMAGQVIMQGFVNFHIPMWVRRLVTMIPALVVVGMGFDATRSLILSQVVLSIALPVPMIALLVLSRKRKVMGEYAMGGKVLAVAAAGAVMVLLLNLVLILQALGVPILPEAK